MKTSPTNSGFTLARRIGRWMAYIVLVASVASAIGFVSAVLVLTKPTRTALMLAPLPAVKWMPQ